MQAFGEQFFCLQYTTVEASKRDAEETKDKEDVWVPSDLESDSEMEEEENGESHAEKQSKELNEKEEDVDSGTEELSSDEGKLSHKDDCFIFNFSIHSQVISHNFLFQSLTRDISYNMENLAFDNLLK